MSEKITKVEYSIKDIKKALAARLKNLDDEKLAEVIIGYLSVVDHALPNLMKALLGIYPAAKYSKGDMVWVKFSILPTWKMDKAQTKTLPHYSSITTYDREGMLLCQITDVNVYEATPYTIDYQVQEGGTIRQNNYTISENYIAYKEESFINILDQLEKTNVPKESDDQPF